MNFFSIFFSNEAEEGAMGSELASRGVAFRQIGGDRVVARLRLYINIALRLSHKNVFFNVYGLICTYAPSERPQNLHPASGL